MHSDKETVLIVKFGKPREEDGEIIEKKEEIKEVKKKKGYDEEKVEEVEEEKKGSRKDRDRERDRERDSSKSYTEEEYGGYSPRELRSKLESIKESISNQNTREALMKIDSCIIRLTKKELPSERKDDVFSQVDFALDKILPNQGKS